MFSSTRSIRTLAVAAMLTASAAVATAVDVLQLAYRRAREAFDWLASLLVPAATRRTPTATQAPPLRTPLLVAARAFNACMLRRDYPHVEQRWRMCPSV